MEIREELCQRCSICHDSTLTYIQPQCGHSICLSCATQVVSTAIENLTSRVQCQYLWCGQEICREDVRRCVGEVEFRRYCELGRKRELSIQVNDTVMLL